MVDAYALGFHDRPPSVTLRAYTFAGSPPASRHWSLEGGAPGHHVPLYGTVPKAHPDDGRMASDAGSLYAYMPVAELPGNTACTSVALPM